MKLGCIALLVAGLIAGPWPAPVEAQSSPSRSASAHAIWIDVPFAAQTKDGCGSASISMVMQYWDRKKGLPVGTDASPMHIQDVLFSRAAHGIYASSMEKYFRQSGYQAFAFRGQWSDLEHHLALGRPLIVGIQPNGAMGPLHYVVVVGIDPVRNFVFVNDPAQQKMLRISRDGFESEWRATRDWTLLAVPKDSH